MKKTLSLGKEDHSDGSLLTHREGREDKGFNPKHCETFTSGWPPHSYKVNLVFYSVCLGFAPHFAFHPSGLRRNIYSSLKVTQAQERLRSQVNLNTEQGRGCVTSGAKSAHPPNPNGLKVSSSFGGSCNVSCVHLDMWTKSESVNLEVLAGFELGGWSLHMR